MAWYDEAVFYHIYPLGLLDAPKENNYGAPVHRLKELNDWIKHIKAVGFNAIYIGPLFESVGHGYETTDYKKLDSRLGDNNDLKQFVENCHKNNIKVIFDGVFNHTGRDFFAFKDIKENRENSTYKDWYCNVNFYGNNEYNDGFSYENWGGYNLLVKLNQRNPAVKDYICDVIRFWVSEFDVDGIRLDAADVLDFDFMKALRSVAEEVKPDFWLMGEVIHGDYTRWVNGNTLHSVTNYALHKALYSGHNEHNYFEIAHTVKRLYEMGGNRPDGLKLYNFTDNHDVERIISKLSNKANFTPVHILEYCLPGVPSIYYGSEFAIEGKKERGSDASLRPALNYSEYKNAVSDNPYTAIIKRLNEVRKSNSVLSYGDYSEKLLTNRQYVFTRNTVEDTAIICVNNDENSCDIHVNGIRDGKYIGTLKGNSITVTNGYFSTLLEANSGEIFVMENSNSTSICKNAIPEIIVKKEEKAKTDIVKSEETKISISTSKESDISKKQIANPNEKKTEEKSKKILEGKLSALEKYSLNSYNNNDQYSTIYIEDISNRSDYDSMTVFELQVAILEKMSKNGPVNDQMIKTVMDNIYPDSLKNWVKSFR